MAKIFLMGLMAILIFNTVYILSSGTITLSLLKMTSSAFIGLILTFIPILIVSLVLPNSAVTNILFGIATILNVLYSVPFTILTKQFTVGLGLITNMMVLFPITFLNGIPYYAINLLGLMMFIDGIIMIIGGNNG